jgi:exopolysaccharide biosynthesis polyprenyl glycosylphosphotransferase
MQSDLKTDMPDQQQETLQEKTEMPSAKQIEYLSAKEKLKERRKPSSASWHLILMLGDVVLLVALFGLLYLFHRVPQIPMNSFGVREGKLMWVCLALVSWSLAVNITQSQQLSYAANRFKGPCCTFFALILMCVFWMFLSYILLDLSLMVSAELELFFLGVAIPLFSIWRFLFAEIKHLPRFQQRAVIVGVNPAGETVAKEIKMSRSSSLDVLGYVGDSNEERTSYAGLPVLGDRDTLHYLIYHDMVDMIIMAVEYGSHPALFKEATDAAQFGISVVPMEVVYESCGGKIPVEHVGDQWYVALQSERSTSILYLIWKKALDLACGLFGLLVLAVVTPILALCIYLDSPGPIFYSQERVGYHGRPFRIYKFRSMRVDAEKTGQAIWASKTDTRVTRIGRFMRATHLDELPQLINILRGEMSLIGPRPERATFIKELEKTIPFYSHRHAVKPGLTGWAQVKYRYGNSDNDSLIKLQYDLYYIKRQSFMLDLFIILNTVIEVLFRKGV